MTIKRDLNQEEAVLKLASMGISPKIARKEIEETIKNDFLWFQIGDVVATYSPRKRKKWCLMYR